MPENHGPCPRNTLLEEGVFCFRKRFASFVCRLAVFVGLLVTLGVFAEVPQDPGHQDEIARYRAQLGSKEARKRASAANQLGHLGAVEAIPELKKMLLDGSTEVQFFALGALIDLDAEGVVSQARRLLGSEDANLKLMAARALLVFEDDESTPRILSLLEEGSAYVQQGLARAVGQARVSKAVPALERLLSSSDRTTRLWALSALGAIGLKTSGPAVAKFVEDQDPEIRLTAIEVVGQIDPKRYQAQLREALESGTDQLRSAALLGLVRIQDPEARKLVVESGMHELLNYYSAPDTCAALERTLIDVRVVRRKSVGDILRVLSDATGIRVEASELVPPKLLSARFGPNLDALGRSPSAMAVVRSFSPWFLSARGRLWFVAEAGLVRVVTPEEAKAFWSKWLKE